jgi:energy-coupling factor transporter ATP-binding protein EcfA2
VQNFELTLTSPVAKSFRATKAANSLDIDAEKKSIHHFKVQADITTPFNIGVIVGASGSGKTTLAKHIYGEEAFKEILNPSLPVIEQFPESLTYDECAAMLCGVGLTAVPCWIRPAYTLSNGQKARAECALQMAREDSNIIVIDEWTSVVDRTVAKVMSHCIQKHARKTGKTVVLLSCHYDVLDWLNPDWIIDANKQAYTNRRLLWQDFKRTEQLQFDIREADKSTWRYFSRYHYLNEKLAGGKQLFYGLWDGNNQIGFLAFTNYVPHRKDRLQKMQLHFNRLVIHPDYCGFGLGIHFLNKCSKLVADQNYEVCGKFSSAPVFNALKANKSWKMVDMKRQYKVQTGPKMGRGKSTYSRADQAARGDSHGFRLNVKTWSFKYVG